MLLSSDELQEMASKKIRIDGYRYVACRPKHPDNIELADDVDEENAPYLIYKVDRIIKEGDRLYNAIRLAYAYQCKYKYGVKVDYYWVSPKELSKVLAE